jgi:NAD(P)-dependent dehydrogenase (short-subunit alcohol dehydrogenase family)
MAKERRRLEDKVVAITGGARGIGKATAMALLRKGCRIAIGDIDADLARETAEALGGGAIGMHLDATDRRSFEAFLDATERELGPLEVLVNNAGIMPVTRFVEESEESMRRQVDLNVHGVLIGTQLAMRRMSPRRRGHIVNVASSAGKVGVPGIATYSGTKHAVVGFSEAVRHELRGSGVDVSIVMPVLVNTALTEGIDSRWGVKEVEPEDVADQIVDALERARVDVFVPRSLHTTLSLGNLLPRRAREAVSRWMGVDKVIIDADPRSRRAYEERAAKSRAEATESEPAESEPAGR